ncbi:MAG: methionyl-tRNA formyltransferase [Clostridiales bacterium]|nr:methionyl-tRNA formyltransferase [Clostridiales bacterium]
MDILFMGTPEFSIASLEAIADSGNNLIGVVTQPDRPRGRGKRLSPSPVKRWALKEDIFVFQPQNINTKDSVRLLSSLEPDLIVTAAYGQILSKAVLEIPPLGCINVHASLLPKYRGAAPIQQAIIDGEKETGITIMYMEEGMDTGGIILQRAISIGPDENAGSLHDRLAILGKEVLRESLDLFKHGRADATKQDDCLATYCKKIDKSLGEIDWQMSNHNIHNLVRGLSPWPGCFTFYEGERLKILETRIVERQASKIKAPGEIVQSDTSAGLIVACGHGLIRLKNIQGEGKRAMKDTTYLMGNPLTEGTILGR